MQGKDATTSTDTPERPVADEKDEPRRPLKVCDVCGKPADQSPCCQACAWETVGA